MGFNTIIKIEITRLLLTMAAIGQVRQDSNDVFAGRSLTSVAHDQHFHDTIVDVLGPSLNDVDIFATNGLLNFNSRFLVGFLMSRTFAQSHIQMPTIVNLVNTYGTNQEKSYLATGR